MLTCGWVVVTWEPSMSTDNVVGYMTGTCLNDMLRVNVGHHVGSFTIEYRDRLGWFTGMGISSMWLYVNH